MSDNLKEDVCLELKTIKYKTMLMSGNMIQETKSSNDLSVLDKFLESEKTTNQNETWSKLDKTVKTKKILQFSEKYSKENNFDSDEQSLLINFLNDCLDRKRLYRVKDVEYDKNTGEITKIPSLFYNKLNHHFTLKNVDKRISTLKSLTPKKNKTTIKNNENS
jgi:hypothetical protein